MTANTSPATTVNAGAFTKLQCCCRARPRRPAAVAGKTGSPSAQTAGSGFNVTVNAVDANWNLVNTVTDTVGDHEHRRQRDAAGERGARRGHEDLRGHRRRRPAARRSPPPTSPTARMTRRTPARRPRSTPAPFTKLQIADAGRDRRPGHRAPARPARPRAANRRHAASTSPSTRSTRTGTWSAPSTDTVGHHARATRTRPCLPTRRSSPARRPSRSPSKTAGSATFTATDISDGTKTANTSPATTINARRVHQAPDPVPGETAAPGSAPARPGTPERADRGHALQRDRQRGRRELEPGQHRHRHRRASPARDANATLPANAALVAGTKTFSRHRRRPPAARTFTATDITRRRQDRQHEPGTTINAARSRSCRC